MPKSDPAVIRLPRWFVLWLVVVAVLIGAFGIGFAIGHATTTTVHLGDLAEWFAAAGTVAAFVFAAFVYQRDLRARRITDRESQARLFDAWVHDSRWEERQYPHSQSGITYTALQVEIQVANGSAQSMRGVDVGVVFGDTPVPPAQMLKVIPPTTPDNPRTYIFDLPPTGDDMLKVPTESLYGALSLNLGFTDASGNRWYRSEDGELRFDYNLAHTPRDNKHMTIRRNIVAFATSLLLALGVGVLMGHTVDKPSANHIKRETFQLKVGNVPDRVTPIHPFENTSTTQMVSSTTTTMGIGPASG